MIHIKFPNQFSKLLKGQMVQKVSGDNIKGILEEISSRHEGVRSHLFLPTGEVSPFLAFVLSGSNEIFTAATVSSLQLNSGDTIEVVLPMAGG